MGSGMMEGCISLGSGRCMGPGSTLWRHKNRGGGAGWWWWWNWGGYG